MNAAEQKRCTSCSAVLGEEINAGYDGKCRDCWKGRKHGGDTPACAVCGSRRFVFYQTITEAADIETFRDGAAVIGDAKWEVTDAIDSEVRCENGHVLPCDPASGLWNGDVE